MKIELIYLDGKRELTVNISGKVVGFGGENFPEDVRLIQGLFNYIAKGLTPGALGLGGDYNLPKISGEMDADTYSAISQFQVINAGSLLMKWFDGRIHRASYGNRHLHTGRNKRYMSITLLHFLATDAAVMQSHYGYIQGLADLDQELAFAIDRAVISQ